MKKMKLEEAQLKLMLAQEEFRYWDAYRNGCTESSLLSIKKSIDKVKANLIALEMILPQTCLS